MSNNGRMRNDSKMYSHPAYSVRTSDTVVTGVDDQFVKSREGILKILQVLFGAISWIIMASLPYMRMIYTQGHTAPFHAIMTLELLAWIATVLILISKACGTGMNSKGFAGCMYKSTWVFVVNAVLFLFFLISACILATNAKRFDLGSSAYSSFGNRGKVQEMNRYGYEIGRSSQGGDESGFNLGSCDSFNVNQPYCAMHAEECRKFFDDCMKIASGTGYNKYYVNAITACVFAFITTILYLVSMVLAFVDGGWTPSIPDLSTFNPLDKEEISNDIEFGNNDDLNRSLRKNTWKNQTKNGRSSKAEISYSEANSGIVKPKLSSTLSKNSVFTSNGANLI